MSAACAMPGRHNILKLQTFPVRVSDIIFRISADLPHQNTVPLIIIISKTIANTTSVQFICIQWNIASAGRLLETT